MSGDETVRSEPEDATQGHDRLLHFGTISGGAIAGFDAQWYTSTGFGGGDSLPALDLALDGPVLDANARRPVSRTTMATGNGDLGSGADGTTLDIQGQGHLSSGLLIIASYDSSITGLPSAQYDAVTGAITAAIDFYEAAITNPITITIDFGFGELAGGPLASGALSESLPEGFNLDYTTLIGALGAHGDPASDLPTADPSGGSGADWFVTDTELSALGYDTGSSPDGYVGLSNTANFTYDPNNRAVSGEYDAIGALEHEISEVMGRVADYGQDNFSPLDLFRYTSAGTIATTGTAAYFSIDGGDTNLDAFNNEMANRGDAGDWSSAVPNDSYDAFSSPGVENSVSSTDLTVMKMLGYSLAPACYAAGTQILTARGEVLVENLAVGDMVQAQFAGLTPIKWIGHRSIDCRRHPDPLQVWPVRVVADAFGSGQPCRDLLLSPDHAVAIDGTLIPIRLLVNGASVRHEVGTRQVHYFHIELGQHDLLLADGLVVESYLDTGNRGTFANGHGPIVLHPTSARPLAQQRREATSCLPLRGDPAQVEPVWRALAARAEHLGLALPVVATTRDPALCVVAGAQCFSPILHNRHRYTFALPALPGGARLRSRRAAPSAVQPWLEDRRRLGVMVRRIALRRGTEVVDVAPDDPCLCDGWWAAERDGTAPWRWTDGDAALPPTDSFAILEVVIGETPPYPLRDPAPGKPMSGVHVAARGEYVVPATPERSAA